MITPEQLQALQDKLDLIADPINEYIISDIVDRILSAGKATSTARYKAQIANILSVRMEEVKLYVEQEAKRENVNFEKLFKDVAKLIYNQNEKNGVVAIPFEDNIALQNIVGSAVKQAEEDFTNITQTLGMVDPYGKALPLQDAYISCCDYAFNKVMTGADTYTNAVEEAVINLANRGVVSIDYETGYTSQLDVAVRRNIFSGMGIMVENIEREIHDQIGADGYELSAHEACAVDHEPYQGRQYTTEQYESLNGSLERRIGTLNCKHVAFPIIIGISQPQYSEDELNAMKERNAEGITYEGKHYTMYEATQMQRAIERGIRTQKKRITVYKQSPIFEKKYTQAKIRLNRLEEYYKDFSEKAGLNMQRQRLLTLGFRPSW